MVYMSNHTNLMAIQDDSLCSSGVAGRSGVGIGELGDEDGALRCGVDGAETAHRALTSDGHQRGELRGSDDVDRSSGLRRGDVDGPAVQLLLPQAGQVQGLLLLLGGRRGRFGFQCRCQMFRKGEVKRLCLGVRGLWVLWLPFNDDEVPGVEA